MPSATFLYSTTEIRGIEAAALASVPAGTLMQRAGEAAAIYATELLGGGDSDASALILAGPGNNGGDALETAWRLADAGVDVTVLLCADPGAQSADAHAALLRAQASTVQFAVQQDWPQLVSRSWQLVVDGLFGIGLTRPITGSLRDMVAALNRLTCPLLALDVPSGLDADTGNIVKNNERDGIAITATHTITFIGNKPGLHTAQGRDYAGIVRVASLQIDEALFPPARAELNAVSLFAHCLCKRAHNTHKGSFGDIAILGGAHGMGGAAILSARAAAKCGAGRVFAAFLDDVPLYDSAQPELMCRQAAALDFSATTVVAGPGLGTSNNARDTLARALATQGALVLDADALNLIATEQVLQQLVAQRAPATVMTPHPLEAARLLGVSSAVVQADRLAAARELANRFRCMIVLKGSGTVIATPDMPLAINPTGNPALATAGTGDVLSGICGALLAQGWPEREAALAAVWLHGHAADRLVESGIGPVGLTASELIPEVRTTLNELIARHARPHLAP